MNSDLTELARRGYRFALALTHDAHRAEDLLQEAWLAVLAARGPLRIEYLLVSIRSRFLDQCRRARLAEFEPFVDDEPRTTSESEEWSDALEWSDQRLGEALGRLRAEERAALYLSAVEGRSAQQIAGLFGWPRSTVLSLVQRARRKLRTWMESPEATR